MKKSNLFFRSGMLQGLVMVLGLLMVAIFTGIMVGSGHINILYCVLDVVGFLIFSIPSMAVDRAAKNKKENEIEKL